LRAKILAAELEEVEGIEETFRGSAGERGAQPVELR
jgi:hypothetical protein